MKMREISGVTDKEPLVNNKLLKHGAHMHITFGQNKDFFDGDFIMGTESMVKLGKSKLSPKFINIPCVISATEGGKIDEVDSFVRYLCTTGIVKTGSWYQLSPTIDLMCERYPELKDNHELMGYRKNMRKGDFYKECHDNQDLTKFLEIRLIDFIDDIYPMQRDVNGEFQNKLKSECKYFNRSNDISDNEFSVDKDSTEGLDNIEEESI